MGTQNAQVCLITIPAKATRTKALLLYYSLVIVLNSSSNEASDEIYNQAL